MKLCRVIFREHIVGLGSSLGASPSTLIECDAALRVVHVKRLDRGERCLVPFEAVSALYPDEAFVPVVQPVESRGKSRK